jgi:ribonuclease HI
MKFAGCSKGNPGLAGAGAVIYEDNHEIASSHMFVGTNISHNYAEYSALLLGMQMALEMNISDLLVEGDSQLIIDQMNGKKNCKSLNLISLYCEAKILEGYFYRIHFRHIYRDYNQRANQLSNIALLEQ